MKRLLPILLALSLCACSTPQEAPVSMYSDIRYEDGINYFTSWYDPEIDGEIDGFPMGQDGIIMLLPDRVARYLSVCHNAVLLEIEYTCETLEDTSVATATADVYYTRDDTDYKVFLFCYCIATGDSATLYCGIADADSELLRSSVKEAANV